MFLDPIYRKKVLKIDTILKKTPSTIAALAKNYLNAKSNPLRKSNQNLHDYGTQMPSRPAEVHHSMEGLPQKQTSDYGDLRPMQRHPQSYPNKNMLLSDVPFNQPQYKTEVSEDSKDTLRPGIATRENYRVDWAKTPLYAEFLDEGITKYNYKGHAAFFDESEATAIYKLLKDRYAQTREHKKVEPIFHKAMDTLGELLGSFNLTQVFRAVQKIYSKADVQNTMKLVLRVQSLMKVRYILFTVFNDIIEFKKMQERIELLLGTDSLNPTRAQTQIQNDVETLQNLNDSLHRNFRVLLLNHKQICKGEFYFGGYEWINHSSKIIARINQDIAIKEVSREDRQIRYL